MTNVTRIRLSDAELLELAFRRAGYTHADELVDLDETGWRLAASNAGLSGSPSGPVRCACVTLFGLPVGSQAQVPAATAGCSPESVTELVGRPGGRAAVPGSTGSNIERKERG